MAIYATTAISAASHSHFFLSPIDYNEHFEISRRISSTPARHWSSRYLAEAFVSSALSSILAGHIRQLLLRHYFQAAEIFSVSRHKAAIDRGWLTLLIAFFISAFHYISLYLFSLYFFRLPQACISIIWNIFIATTVSPRVISPGHFEIFTEASLLHDIEGR